MKKTYITPETNNIFIRMQHMFCGSEKLNGAKSVTNYSDLQSRRFSSSYWDDDEEE